MMGVRILKKQTGFTLIELMISMVLGLIVIGGTLSMYITTIKSSADTVKGSRLNYDLDSVMALTGNDIKRAGYWAGAVTGSDARTNPFMAAATSIVISNKTGEANNSCILYMYDVDDGDNATNPELPDGILNLNEYYGFRMNGTGIDMRFSVSSTANIGCNDGNWEGIVDTNKVTITGLQFSFLPVDSNGDGTNDLIATTRCLDNSLTPITDFSTTCAIAAADVSNGIVAGHQMAETHVINITLTGEVKGDNVVTKTLLGSVQVRNDRIFTQ